MFRKEKKLFFVWELQIFFDTMYRVFPKKSTYLLLNSLHFYANNSYKRKQKLILSNIFAHAVFLIYITSCVKTRISHSCFFSLFNL